MTLLIIMFAGIFLLSLPVNHKVYWKYTASILVLISAGYFLCTPETQDDLYRHYILLDQIRTYDLDVFDTSNHYWNENPVFVMLLFVISFFPSNAFLPFLVGSVYYLSSLFLIRKASLDSGRDTREIIAVIILLMVADYIAISGIRNFLCDGIFLIGLYYDLVMKKKKGFLLYILATLIHTAGFLYILVRLIMCIYSGKKKVFILGCCLLIPFLLTTYAASLAIILSGVPIVGDAFSRFIAYTVDKQGMIVSESWRYFYAVTYLFIFAFMSFYEKIFDQTKKYRSVFQFVTILLVITFGFWNERSLFNRQTYILLPLGIMYYVLLKNRVFKMFPTVAIKNISGQLSSYFSILICYAFLAWAFVYFMVFVLFHYADFYRIFP